MCVRARRIQKYLGHHVHYQFRLRKQKKEHFLLFACLLHNSTPSHSVLSTKQRGKIPADISSTEERGKEKQCFISLLLCFSLPHLLLTRMNEIWGERLSQKLPLYVRPGLALGRREHHRQVCFYAAFIKRDGSMVSLLKISRVPRIFSPLPIHLLSGI